MQNKQQKQWTSVLLDIIGFFVVLPVFVELVYLARCVPLLFQVKTLHSDRHALLSSDKH